MACANFIDNLVGSDSDEEIMINEGNILDDDVYILCNKLVYYLNEDSEDTLLNITTITTHFYHLRKTNQQQHEYSKTIELLREYREVTHKLMINISKFIKDYNHLSLVKRDINNVLTINGRLKFHYFINLVDFNLVAVFDYQNRYLSLNLIKYYLFGFYIEFNQNIENFIETLNNCIHSFKDSILEFMEIFVLFKVYSIF
jgi:hypothetical protein